MQKFLYLLSEGRADGVFYQALCERVSGWTFFRVTQHPLRSGEMWRDVLGKARWLMNYISYLEGSQDIVAVVAVDNDRCPGHPEYAKGKSCPNQPGKSASKKTSRYEELCQIVRGKRGDAAPTSVRIAIAVPVEMIESWVLLLLDPTRPELPHFAEAAQPSAINHYRKAKAPPQLKDLVKVETKARKMDTRELFLKAAKEGDLPAAMSRSHSLAMFVEEIRQFA